MTYPIFSQKEVLTFVHHKINKQEGRKEGRKTDLKHNYHLELIKKSQSSDPIIYSLLQKENQFFDHKDGFIAYRIYKNRMIALGPAVTKNDNQLKAILDDFIHFARINHKIPDFFYLNSESAVKIQNLYPELIAQPIGVETIIDVQKLSEHGLKNKKIASAVKKFSKYNGNIEFLDKITTEIRNGLKQITKYWLENKNTHDEIDFICRQMIFDDELEVIKGQIKIDPERVYHYVENEPSNSIFGYFALDPYAFDLENGLPKGYLMNIIRTLKTKNWGVYYAVVYLLAMRLKLMNVKEISLGWSPFYKIYPSDPLNYSKVFNHLIEKIILPFGEKEYNFSNLGKMKAIFCEEPFSCGRETQRYFLTFSNNFFRYTKSMLSTISCCGFNTSYLSFLKNFFGK